MNTLLTLAAALVLGWAVVDMAVTGQIRTKAGELFWKRDEDPQMFWISWGFFVMAFLYFLLSLLGVFG